MDISTANGIRVITPAEGLWLYKESTQTISDKVYLGKYDTEDGWVEISEERKEELESLWESDNYSSEAEEDDYIQALESLGVGFNG